MRAQPSQHAGQAAADDVYRQSCQTSRQQPLETEHLSERRPRLKKTDWQITQRPAKTTMGTVSDEELP